MLKYMRQNKTTIFNSIQKCISFSDYQLTYWTECLNNIPKTEEPIEVSFCNNPKEGECFENISYFLKIGEPFLRGIYSFDIVVQYSLDGGDFTTFKSFTKTLENIDSKLENYFEEGIINTQSVVEDKALGGGIFKFRILFKTNIDSDYKILPTIFHCEKIGKIPPVTTDFKIAKNNDTSIFLGNEVEQLVVNVNSTNLPLLNKIKQGFYYILEREENGNYVELEHSVFSEDLQHIFNFDWRKIYNYQNSQNLRVKVVIQPKYKYLNNEVLYTNIVTLNKYIKPNYKTIANFSPEQFIDEYSLTPKGDFSIFMAVIDVDKNQRISDFKSIKNITFEKYFEIDGQVKSDADLPTSNWSTVYDIKFPNKNIQEKYDVNLVKISSTFKLKWNHTIEYIYDYWETDHLTTDLRTVNINVRWAGSDRECLEELRNGQMVKTNEVRYNKRVKYINDVQVLEEPNVVGENHISNYIDALECKTVYLSTFDGLVLHNRYVKGVDGIDLDIAIGFHNQNNLPNGYVGCGLSKTFTVDNKDILIFGGDDHSKNPQSESVVIYFKNLPEITDEVVILEVWAGWHNSRITGNYKLILEGYKGGTFVFEDGGNIYAPNSTSIYKNEGGILSFKQEYTVNAPSARCGSLPRQGSKKHIANIHYNTITKDAKLQIL